MMPIPSSIERFFATSQIPLTLAATEEPDQPLVMVNDAFCKLTGFSREKMLGRNCRLLQGARTEAAARQELRNAIDGGRDAQVLITNYRSDGSVFENLLFLYALEGLSGPTYFMGSQFDTHASAPLAPLDDHARILDAGVARIIDETRHIHIRTRQLLAQTAVNVLRARLNAPG